MANRKNIRPGPGWKHLNGPVWEHETGVRVHVSGTVLKFGDEKAVGAAELDRFYKMWRSLLKWCVAVNGGNKKRGMMVFALAMAKYINCYKCNQNGETANACRCDELIESTKTAGYVAVPVEELKKLEKSRKKLYEHLGDHVGSVMMENLTRQIWLVANTKKWK